MMKANELIFKTINYDSFVQICVHMTRYTYITVHAN